jgi:outer membrane protein
MVMDKYLSSFTYICVLFFSCISFAMNKDGLLEVYYDSIKYYPELKQGNIDVLRAQEAIKQSRSSLFPAVSANAGYKHSQVHHNDNTDKSNSSSISLSINQPIFDLTKWSITNQSKLAKDKAELGHQLALQQHILKISKYYFNVLISKSSFKEAQSQEYALQQYKNQIKEMYSVGYSKESDALEAEAAYETAKAMSLEKKLDIEVNIKFLESLIGRPINNICDLADEIPMQQFIAKDLQVILSESRNNNAAIKIAALEIQEQENLLTTNKRKHLPTIGVFSKIERSFLRNDDTGSDSVITNKVEAGANFTMPLYSGGKTISEVKESSLALDKSHRKLETIIIETTLDIEKLFTKLRTSIEILGAQYKSVIASENNLNSIHHSYEAGTKNITDVLNARQKVFAARLQYLKSKYGIILDYLNMKFLAGDISENDLKLLAKYLK